MNVQSNIMHIVGLLTILTYIQSRTVSKMFHIIGYIFAFDRGGGACL